MDGWTDGQTNNSLIAVLGGYVQRRTELQQHENDVHGMMMTILPVGCRWIEGWMNGCVGRWMGG